LITHESRAIMRAGLPVLMTFDCPSLCRQKRATLTIATTTNLKTEDRAAGPTPCATHGPRSIRHDFRIGHRLFILLQFRITRSTLFGFTATHRRQVATFAGFWHITTLITFPPIPLTFWLRFSIAGLADPDVTLSAQLSAT